jgi:hypothetical protein
MIDEPVAVRLARIEDGLVNIHSKLETNHEAVMGQLVSQGSKLEIQGTDIEILKRDRFWVFTLVSLAFGTASYAVLELIGHLKI